MRQLVDDVHNVGCVDAAHTLRLGAQGVDLAAQAFVFGAQAADLQLDDIGFLLELVQACFDFGRRRAAGLRGVDGRRRAFRRDLHFLQEQIFPATSLQPLIAGRTVGDEFADAFDCADVELRVFADEPGQQCTTGLHLRLCGNRDVKLTGEGDIDGVGNVGLFAIHYLQRRLRLIDDAVFGDEILVEDTGQAAITEATGDDVDGCFGGDAGMVDDDGVNVFGAAAVEHERIARQLGDDVLHGGAGDGAHGDGCGRCRRVHCGDA